MGPFSIAVIILALETLVLVDGQFNGVKQTLVPCYNDSAIPGITIANNRLPMNLNIFLELLRRLEDANPSLSVRELSVLILQQLRQSGIESAGRTTNLNIAIPFSPNRLEAIKGTVILQQYITSIQQILNYGDLDQADICSLHYMISNTINNTVRGDESLTCVRSARYQVRMRRDLENDKSTTKKLNGGKDEGRDTEQVEKFSPRQLSNSNSLGEKSQCPIELGVVYTNYGSVKIGQVLSGLAAAYNPESHQGADNRYASTLSGDLAHAALSQATEELKLGTSGGWNSSINPKYFFLEKNRNLDLTDQDIRGSVDGLLMALQLDSSIRKRYSDIKLSQILDMYYSPIQRGVFDSTFRACNRNILYSEYISFDRLKMEISAIMVPLDNFGLYPVTVTSVSYPSLVDAAISNFSSYLPRIKDRDFACPVFDSTIERIDTDLLIFLDASWSYTTVQPILSYILDNIDVSKYNSRYSLFNGVDGRNLTNSTHHLLDFYKVYNLSVHEQLNKGFDYSKVFEVIESVVRSKLNNKTYTGGESTIVLLMPTTAPDENQKNFLNQQKEKMRRFMPDVSVLVLGSGTGGDYSSVLDNPNRDFTSLTASSNENELKNTAQNVLDRIKNIPMSVINPNCGSEFGGPTSTFVSTQYVDLNSVNYHKIAPNYFLRGGSKNLRITELNTGSITVCLSRQQSKPNNETSECRTVQSTAYITDVSNWCGDNMEDCAPIYLSVYGNTTQYRCKDYLCRFPDTLKYSISLENVACASGTLNIAANFFLVASLFVFLRFKMHNVYTLF